MTEVAEALDFPKKYVQPKCQVVVCFHQSPVYWISFEEKLGEEEALAKARELVIKEMSLKFRTVPQIDPDDEYDD